MLGKYSVKKPYTVVVGVILSIILGVISFTNMTTDLLPSMNFPYVIVYTTYVGATPEQVEEEITRPMESSFATLTDIKNISSTSSDNLSLVVLEFNDTADMNTALIEINSKISTLSATWSDSIGAPAIMKINPDMLPVSIVSVSKDDMDILELSEYVEETLIPEYEAINGVASVTASGMITQQVDVTIEQDRIDVLNNAILRDIDEELADAEQQLNDAQAQISDGKSQLARAKKSTLAQLDAALAQLEDGELKLSEAIEQLTTQRAELQTQLDEVNAAIEQLEGLTNLTDEQKALLRELETQLGNLRARKEALEKQLEALENGQGSEELEAQRAEAVAKRDGLMEERTRYEEYIADLKEADPDSLQAEIDALNGQIEDAKVELETAQTELQAKTDARDATQVHIDQLKEEIAKLEGATATPETSATPSPEATATPEASATPSPEATATTTPEGIATASPEATATTTPEGTATASPEATATAAPANTVTASPEATATAAPENTVTASPEATATTAPENTVTASPETTATAAPENMAAVSPEATATVGPEATDAPTEQPTVAPAEPLDNLSLAAGFAARAEGESLEELKAELAAAEEALKEMEASVVAAQEAVDQRQTELDNLNAELESKQQALEDIQSGDVTSRIEAAEREVTRLNLRIAALDAEIEGLDDLLSGDSETIEGLKVSLKVLDEAITAIENSDEYKALQLALDEDELNAQYAAALEGKARLEEGIAQIDAVLEKLNQGIIPGGVIEGIDEDTNLADARDQLESGRDQALAGFADAEAQLDAASAELAEARKEFEDKRDEALENAGLDGIITMETVAGLIGAQNISMPAGYVYDVSGDEYLVRVGDKFSTLDELKQLKLFSVGLESVDEVRLMDVASVEITDNRDEAFTKVDGQDGILLSIEKQSTFSTTDVSDRVAEKNAELIAEIDGLHIVDMFNQGDYINIIVDSVLQNLVWGGLLAVLVLLIFLTDWRPTIIIAFSIPISVVAAFVCMYFTGITLNVLSLSGLALGIGMLVDNSIVAIENIYRLHDEEHLPILTACVRGVNSIAGALIASTLTTICVFLPVVFVTGLARDLFMDIGLTITFSLLASLIVAMTLVPSMAAGLLKRSKKPHKNRFIAIQRGYVRMLKGALRFKALVLVVAVVLLVFAGMQVSKMGMSFMPEVNSTQMTATLNLDPQQDLEPQQERALEMMNRIMEVDGIETVGLSGGSGMMSMTGGSDSLTYYIIVSQDAGRSNAEIAEDIRGICDEMALPLSIQTSTMDISMLTGSGISVDITGDDVDTLRSIASDVAEIVASVEGTTDIDDGQDAAVPEMRITVDREKATDHNLTTGQVLQFVATKLAGKTEISEATLDGKTLSIYILDGRNSTITPGTLEDLEIEVTNGDKSEMVRIGDIATVEQTQSLSSINRQAQQRILTVSFQVEDGYSMNHVSDAVEEKLNAYQPPEGYEIALSGENETVLGIMDDLVFMLVIAVALIFLIMVAQFQSFKSPIIVMFTIPLAFTGGLIALLITGMDLSIVAMVGFLVLSGVVVNNGIVFVDSVNQLRIAGMSKREALLETGRLRLRPILMTAVTTILGMFTMALGVGMGAEMMQPMAVVTIGGLTYATLMTLFIVPILYDLVNGEKMSAREIQMAKEAAGLNPDEDPDKPDGPKDPPPAGGPGSGGAAPQEAPAEPEEASAPSPETDSSDGQAQSAELPAQPVKAPAEPCEPSKDALCKAEPSLAERAEPQETQGGMERSPQDAPVVEPKRKSSPKHAAKREEPTVNPSTDASTDDVDAAVQPASAQVAQTKPNPVAPEAPANGAPMQFPQGVAPDAGAWNHVPVQVVYVPGYSIPVQYPQGYAVGYQPGYVPQNGSAPQPAYAPQGGYVPQPGSVPPVGYGYQPGYVPQGGAVPQPAYAPQGGYVPQTGYVPPVGYGYQPGYVPQNGSAPQPGYVQQNGSAPQPGYAPQGGYVPQAGPAGYVPQPGSVAQPQAGGQNVAPNLHAAGPAVSPERDAGNA